MLFTFEPLSNALKMNVLNGSDALAWYDERILHRVFLRRQANTALYLLYLLVFFIHVESLSIFLDKGQVRRTIGLPITLPRAKPVEIVELALIFLRHVYGLDVGRNTMEAADIGSRCNRSGTFGATRRLNRSTALITNVGLEVLLQILLLVFNFTILAAALVLVVEAQLSDAEADATEFYYVA